MNDFKVFQGFGLVGETSEGTKYYLSKDPDGYWVFRPVYVPDSFVIENGLDKTVEIRNFIKANWDIYGYPAIIQNSIKIVSVYVDLIVDG